MKIKNLALVALFFCFAYPVFSQKFIEKPYTSWSKDDALKVLSDSPWSYQYQSTAGLAAVGRQQTARDQADNRLGGSERGSSSRNLTTAPVVIRLHSGLPVRQAIVRLQQIQDGYDKMNDEQRAKFDESAKGFLYCALCQNYYIVTITKFKDTSAGFGIDDGIFQTMTLNDIKGKVWLVNDKGEKREVEQFTPPKGGGDSAVFFFKKTDEKGAPFLTPENKDFKFVFSNEFLDRGNAYAPYVPRNFEFKVSKLIADNKVQF
jgi:hypothetical protein